MKYSKKKIIKALLFTPLPLLFFSCLVFMIMNSEFKLSAVFAVFFGHGLVYLAYCILAVPFGFIMSATLNRFGILNLITISLSSIVMAFAFFTFLQWGHTGDTSKEWWKLYTNIPAIIMALFPGLCYWIFLTTLKDKEPLKM